MDSAAWFVFGVLCVLLVLALFACIALVIVLRKLNRQVNRLAEQEDIAKPRPLIARARFSVAATTATIVHGITNKKGNTHGKDK